MRLAGLALLAAMAAQAMPAQAALYVRGGGTMVYDDVLDVTWAADAGPVFADANQARAYAAGLTLGGFTDWRLPSIYDKGTTNVCEGFNCPLSELGRMHYINLGAVAGQFTFAGSNAANIALFSNYAGANRWAYEENFTLATSGSFPPGGCNLTPGLEDCAWQFRNDGIQSYGGIVQPFKAWAVRDGDVEAAPVPGPGGLALLATGLGLVAGGRSRRTRAHG